MESIKGTNINYYYITTLKDLTKSLNILKAQKEIAVDTETYGLFSLYKERASGLDPYTSNIRLIQINYLGNKEPYIFDVLKLGKENISSLIELLNNINITKIFFNSSFDRKIIYHNFKVWLTNCKCCRVSMKLLGQCTGYKSALIRGYSYRSMVRDYFRQDISKTEQSSDWGTIELSPEQLEYAALDVGAYKWDKDCSSYLLEGYNLFKELLLSSLPNGFDIGEIYEIEQEANNIASKIEYTGLPINEDLLFKFLEGANTKLQDYKIKICKLLNITPSTKLVATDKGLRPEIFIPEEVNKLLNSPKRLSEYVNRILGEDKKLTNMQTANLKKVLNNLKQEVNIKDKRDEEQETELGSIEELEELEDFKTGIELIDNILEYKKIIKLIEKEWKVLINVETGCIHANINSIGAATGRMSSGGEILGQKFNAQQLAKTEIEIEIEEDLIFKSKSKIIYSNNIERD